jgi:hypothetical protein
MRRRRTVALLATLVTAIALASPVAGHGGREVAGYAFTVGFMNEPVFTGQSSGLEFFVARDEQPVEGLEETLTAEVSHGGSTRQLELSPRFGEAGWYQSVFFPTAAGRYAFRIHGTIDGTEVDETFTSGVDGFGDVAEVAGGQFPVQLPPAGDVAADAEAGAGAATTAMVGLVLGAAGLLVGLAALGMAFAGRRRTA